MFLEPRTPWWYAPLEAILRTTMDKEKRTYRDFLKLSGDGWVLKEREELELDWLKYYQLKNKFGKDKELGFNLDKSSFEKIVDKGLKGIISRLYVCLAEIHLEDNRIKNVMIAWAKDLGRSILLEEWELLWKREFKFSISSSIKENMYKMFYRSYITPEILAKIYKDNDGKCWRCKKEKGTFFHVWWLCTEVQKFWKTVIIETNKLIKQEVKKSPLTCLLGMFPNAMDYNSKEICQYSFVAARMTIAKNWKGEKNLTKKEWSGKLMEYMQMAKLTIIF